MTKRGKPTTKRWYDDACGTALAMELLGERWALLVVRELMFGPRRFGELRASLPGISANVLTQRLEGLERVGIVGKRKLPPPASVQVYELTPWGYESETAMQELGRWAVRSPLHDPTLPLSSASLMMSLRTMFAPERAGDWTATIGLRMGEEAFVARIEGGALAIARGQPEGADAVFSADPKTLVPIFYGGRPIADAEAAGTLRLEGDRRIAERFVTLFALPPKTAAPSGG